MENARWRRGGGWRASARASCYTCRTSIIISLTLSTTSTMLDGTVAGRGNMIMKSGSRDDRGTTQHRTSRTRFRSTPLAMASYMAYGVAIRTNCGLCEVEITHAFMPPCITYPARRHQQTAQTLTSRIVPCKSSLACRPDGLRVRRPHSCASAYPTSFELRSCALRTPETVPRVTTPADR